VENQMQRLFSENQRIIELLEENIPAVGEAEPDLEQVEGDTENYVGIYSVGEAFSLISEKKEELKHVQEKRPGFPGPGASALCISMIKDGMEYECSSWEEWIDTPEGRIRFAENSLWMSADKNFFKEHIETILEKIDWDREV